MWLLRIDEATYLLIEGLGPQEDDRHHIILSPVPPFALTHSPQNGSTVNEEHDLLDRLEEVTKVRQRVRELLSSMQSQKGEDAGESS